jgi:hypothetical protein
MIRDYPRPKDRQTVRANELEEILQGLDLSSTNLLIHHVCPVPEERDLTSPSHRELEKPARLEGNMHCLSRYTHPRSL